MSKNDNVPTMYLKNPTVAALNQVPGFDPMKLLRRMVSPKTGEEVFRLDLQYKKLWFRLAHPQGRIRLKPLRITEQLAIYEAHIYLNREDPEAVSNFTACILRSDAPNGQYVQAAQEEAVDKALTDAGFGIQLSDVSVPESKRHFGCEDPLNMMQGETDATEQALKPGAIVKPAEKRVRRAAVEKPAVLKPPAPTAEQPKLVEEKKQEPAPAIVQTNPSEKPAVAESPVKKSGADQALEILRGASAAAPEAKKAEQPVASAAPTYTKDMPVEQIVELMTLEQAKKVVVDVGTCRGKTMEEVAARRIASVRFYLTAGYTSDNNIVRAAARIVLDNLDVKKAGYCIVNAGGDVHEDGSDTKISCTELTIIKRLSRMDFFLHALAFMVDHPRREWSSHVSRDRGQAQHRGYAVVRGTDPVARGDVGCILAFAKEDSSGNIIQVALAEVDGKRIIPDVWYGVDLVPRKTVAA